MFEGIIQLKINRRKYTHFSNRKALNYENILIPPRLSCLQLWSTKELFCSYNVVVSITIPSQSRSLNISIVVWTCNESVTGTPGYKGNILIPEPSCCNSVQKSSIQVGDSCSYFTSRNSSSKITRKILIL